jgi:hypothetical protein
MQRHLLRGPAHPSAASPLAFAPSFPRFVREGPSGKSPALPVVPASARSTAISIFTALSGTSGEARFGSARHEGGFFAVPPGLGSFFSRLIPGLKSGAKLCRRSAARVLPKSVCRFPLDAWPAIL